MTDKKAQLLQIIDDQKQEIEKYKTKLRDVVHAYKNLTKEKEALEQSLNALSAGGGNNETEDAKQVAALVSSLNTVSAAKAALEVSLLADNKLMREEKLAAEKTRDELVERVKAQQLEVEEWKAKGMVERHERDKEQADHGAVMKELQQLIAVERQARMAAEASAAGNHVVQSDVTSAANLNQYKREVDKLQRELERTRRKLEIAETAASEPPLELIQLQEQVRGLQTGHEAALQRERMRTQHTEEKAKRHALAQEARIINLENKLAELSHTVGNYDKLRLLHEGEIFHLRQKIALGEENKKNGVNEVEGVTVAETTEESRTVEVVSCENSLQLHENNTHVNCEKERQELVNQLEKLTVEQKKEHQSKNTIEEDSGVIEAQQNRIRSLVEDLTSRDAKHARDIEHYKHKIRSERAKAKESVAASESEWLSRLHQLEGQLEKLRDRSVSLIREKDQQIVQLQTSLQTTLPGGGTSAEVPWHGPRMLHYANEVARRDVDMAALRRVKHNLQEELREQQRGAETLRHEVQELHAEIARLSRCQERGGANMEYLKNVVLNFLMTPDPGSKRHMCNAISAVLKLTPQEQERIAKQPHNSWLHHPS